MKTTYKPLLVLCMILSGFTSSAQDRSIQLGIKGGLNLSYLSVGKEGVPDSKLLQGGNIGFTATYPLGSSLALQSGLSFTTKGGKITGEPPMGFGEELREGKNAILQSNQMYLQLPVYLVYQMKLSPETGLLIHAGPYFAEGIAGKTKLSGNIIHGDAIYFDEIKRKTFGDDGLKKFDFGIGAGIGIDFGEVILGVDYELGLTDIGPANEPMPYRPFYNGSYKNRNASLSLAYRF